MTREGHSILGVPMGPAKSMGTFLRVWRAEWAALTRAQLAIALHAASPRARGVTPRVIRRWEEGQVPGTTAELEALLTVMRRHGLTQFEVEQFRQAVFAACLDRHFSGLFPDDDFVARRDCDDLAEGVWQAEVARPGAASSLALVGRVDELRRAVRTHTRPAAAGTQERRQEAALGHLGVVLACRHFYVGRLGAMDAQCRANADLLELRFGARGLATGPFTVEREGAGDQYLSPLGQRVTGQQASAWRDRRAGAAAMERHLNAALGIGDIGAAMMALGHRLVLLAHAGLSIPATEHLVDEYVRIHQELGRADNFNPYYNGQLFLAHLLAGNLDAAEKQLLPLEAYQDHPQQIAISWYWLAGKLCTRRGQTEQAASFLEKGVRLAQQRGMQHWEQYIGSDLEECRRLAEAKPHRRPWGSNSRARKSRKSGSASGAKTR